jgi:hypothetical protein
MDVASLMTGVIIGSVVCGVVGLLIGMVIGSLSGRSEAARRLWNDLIADTARHLEHDEMYSVHFNVGKQFTGDGGFDEDEDSSMFPPDSRFERN